MEDEENVQGDQENQEGQKPEQENQAQEETQEPPQEAANESEEKQGDKEEQQEEESKPTQGETEKPEEEYKPKREFTAEEFLGKDIADEVLKAQGDYNSFLLKDEDMYVSNPQLIQEKIKVKSHIEYTVQGSKVPTPITRRFKDFYILRLKLTERWPGIYIPRTPHRKTFGNKNDEVVEERIEMINEFCSKISKISYLFNGDEMNIFLQTDEGAIKQLEDLPKPTYEDLLFKYQNAFPDYDENYDFADAKTEVLGLYHKLKESIPIITKFMDGITGAKKHFVQKKLDIFNSLKQAKKFEEGFLGKYSRNEELIFNNISNDKVESAVKKYEEFAKNSYSHYDNFYNKILSHFLTIQALIECVDGFASLSSECENLKNKLKQAESALEKSKAGSKSIKGVVTMKSQEEDLNMLTEGKEGLEKKINDLTAVLQISLYQIRKQYQAFRIISIDRIYKMYKLLINDTKKFSEESDKLFNEIINHPNLKNIDLSK